MKNFNKKNFLYALITIIFIVVFDQFSKDIIYNLLLPLDRKILEITPFFNLVSVYNFGVSFGMFNSLANGKIILSALTIIITIILFIWLVRADNKNLSLALALIIGGAIGNLIDRITIGAVYDFLDFHAYGHHWPAFNVADSSIFIGVFWLIFITHKES